MHKPSWTCSSTTAASDLTPGSWRSELQSGCTQRKGSSAAHRELCTLMVWPDRTVKRDSCIMSACGQSLLPDRGVDGQHVCFFICGKEVPEAGVFKSIDWRGSHDSVVCGGLMRHVATLVHHLCSTFLCSGPLGLEPRSATEQPVVLGAFS